MVVCGGWGKKTHTRGDDLLVGPPSYRTIHSVLVLKPGKPPQKVLQKVTKSQKSRERFRKARKGATKSYKKPGKLVGKVKYYFFKKLFVF